MTAAGGPSELLDSAQREARAIAQLPDGLTLTDAYRIQHELLERRLARGEQLVGTKLGFTSKAKMAQMGVSEIIVGQLTDAMQVLDGGELALSRLIHPRIEPEVAFRIAVDVDLANPALDIESAVDAVAPALEIIDSRYREFRFSLADVIADNTSASAFVVGPWSPIADTLRDCAVELVVNGAVVEAGSTEAILGHPLTALRALVPIAAKYGFTLSAGQIVLAGAATAAVPFGADLVEARVAGLGSVTVRGVDG